MRKFSQKKKEEIWLRPMTKAPTSTEKSKKQRDNIKNATKNFDYTTIADRLRTVSWSNSCHPTGVVKYNVYILASHDILKYICDFFEYTFLTIDCHSSYSNNRYYILIRHVTLARKCHVRGRTTKWGKLQKICKTNILKKNASQPLLYNNNNPSPTPAVASKVEIVIDEDHNKCRKGLVSTSRIYASPKMAPDQD